MLARKYDNYAWEQIEYKSDLKPARKVKVFNYKLLLHRGLVVFAVIMAIYFMAVVRSEYLNRSGNELVSLKQQENVLLFKNSELKIEVEQLKGPERITGIAEKQLGMNVARNNIYVKADSHRIAYDGYAYAK